MSEKARQRYQNYLEITQKAADFNNAAAVLSWDQEVYMPPKGFDFRGRQLATLAAQAHELLTSEEYGNLLHQLSEEQLPEDQFHNVRLSLDDFDKNRKLSATFVEQLARQQSASYNAWLESRKHNRFDLYAAELGKMIVLKKQQAELYGYSDHPYDALLDDYEKGATVAMLNPVFAQMSEQLTPLLQEIRAAEQADDSFFRKNYPTQEQFDFTLYILRKIGYDFEAGRQDYSEHPFSISFAPTDSRVTTRVDEKNLSSILWSSIHEGGHALYEQGLSVDHYGLPLGAPTSLSIHESQSRLWENGIGRSLAFWRFCFPELKSRFPSQLADVSELDFFKAANKVSPSLIRTEADELTYHFHVMIRFEIEKEIICGSIPVNELPELWDAYYKKHLGISAPDAKQGILQDVHWSHGSFGYFPTYSLGSFYAAQFLNKAEKDLKDLEQQILNGQFGNLLDWLRRNIHQHGRRYTSAELCERITGKPLDISQFVNYLKNKYATVYDLSKIEHVS